jgi:hypothetical protein
MRRHRHLDAESEWGRGKLLAVLATGAVALLAVVVGLGLGVYYSVLAGPADSGTDGAGSQDGFGASPEVNQGVGPSTEAATGPSELSTETFEEIVLPAPTVLGPVGVSSGFPRTPEGALAQLSAIDQRVLQAASVDVAQQVITQWAVLGGPTAESWSGVQAVAALLSSAGATHSGDSALTVSASPEMGLIREVDEAGAVVCVGFVVTATKTKTASVASADCQRMTWVEGRWMIGAGDEPEQAPSVWPGTKAALEAGYRVLR